MFSYIFVSSYLKAMYQILIVCHSIVRWLLVSSLVFAIYRAFKGYGYNLAFSKTDNVVRHWTATIAHIQLVIGITLYFQSPLVKYFWKNIHGVIRNADAVFFGLLHMILMLTAIVIITIGSALSKREPGSKEKFRTQLKWFSIGFVIIFIAIPWPFSPFANRPYFR